MNDNFLFKDFLDTSDLNSKLDEVFANDNPVLKKTLKICLDALVCLHSKSISSCQLKEQSCLESIDPGKLTAFHDDDN